MGQWLITLSGFVASSTSCSDSCLTNTWYKWIWSCPKQKLYIYHWYSCKRSKLGCIKSGVQQGLVLALLLYNIYIYNLLSLVSNKYVYVDDLTFLHILNNWKGLKGFLSKDMTTLSEYFQTYRLKLCHSKTVTTAFHLNNRKTRHEFAVYKKKLLPFYTVLTYLGVKLDRSFTSCRHIETLCKKTEIKCCTVEATCRVRMGCWCKSTYVTNFQNFSFSCSKFFKKVFKQLTTEAKTVFKKV